MRSIDFVHEAKTIATKTNVWSVEDNKAALPGCVTLSVCLKKQDRLD